MEWFGWLTKGRCEVSLLDIVILLSEVIGTIILIAGIFETIGRLEKWLKRQK